MESRKNDIIEDKLRWDLLPLSLIKEVVKIFHFGAKKYSPNSWQNLEDGYNRYKAAFFRHTEAFESGEFLDKESNLPHMAHAAWNALAMLYFSLKNAKNHEKEEIPR